MKSINTTYGVVVAGISGRTVVQCQTKPMADRVRRVVRAHEARGGWTGISTLRALVDLAANRHGCRTQAILSEFDETGRAMRATRP